MNDEQVWTAVFWMVVAMTVAMFPIGVLTVRELVREGRRDKEATAFEPFVHEVSERLALPEDEVATALREAGLERTVVLTPAP